MTEPTRHGPWQILSRAEVYRDPWIEVVVSASEANRQRAVEAGADAFLLKPLDQATFLAAVKGALGEVEVPAPVAPPE